MKNPRIAGLFVSLSVIVWLFFSFFLNLEYLFAFVGGAVIFFLGMLAVWTGFYATATAIHIGVWVTLLPTFFVMKSCIENAEEMGVLACPFVGIPISFIFGVLGFIILVVGIGLDIAKRSMRSINRKITGEYE